MVGKRSNLQRRDARSEKEKCVAATRAQKLGALNTVCSKTEGRLESREPRENQESLSTWQSNLEKSEVK